MLDEHLSDSSHVQSRIPRIALAALAAICSCAWGASASTAASGPSKLVIVGAGNGHGVGMSQDGALGYAEHGWSYTAILGHYYQGTAIGQVAPSTTVKVLVHGKVKRVALETYVRGVVAAEVSASWPMAALEAQAVASRTYAITAHAGSSRFDVYPDNRSQVYLGKTAETPRTNAAVTATAGQVVTYDGQTAITYFFADSGGQTESVQNAFPGSLPEPWLVGVPDPYSVGPLHSWKITMSFNSAASRLKGLVRGSLKGIEVLKRGTSPRVVSAYVLGSKGRTLVSGAELAARLRLYDTWAYFSVVDSRGTHREPDVSGWSAPAPVTPTQTESNGASAPPTQATARQTNVSGAGGATAPVGEAGGGMGAPKPVNGQGGVSSG